MASGKTLRQLIQAGATGNVTQFRHVSAAVIEQERQKQHHLLANDLEKILYGESCAKPTIRTEWHTTVPKDKERGLPLLQLSQPQRAQDELILPATTMNALEELLEEHRRADVLQTYGMQPARKLLFYGPPGCGKTFTAEVIAHELDLPLAVVRLDALVSSFLGETAVNLRQVFDWISEYPAVVLFDEFDALGKQRTDSSEHGELRRVVNAVLQMMDAWQGKSIIIAATNHEQLLDPAIWRRFDETLSFPLPNQAQLKKLLALKLRGVRYDFETDEKKILQLFAQKSPADIERVARRAIKRMILRKQEFLDMRLLEDAAKRENRTGQ
jgi:SpoVK/Ycf46/Vps4 family AAA+-type ATPase